ncbi:UNVERIFIED_CONTAM: hypothetical protein FKN15_007683 [Acipenser sinensis]
MLQPFSQLASLEGAEKLGLAGFPSVDCTIAALVKAPPVVGIAQRSCVPEPAVQGYRDTLKESVCSGGRVTDFNTILDLDSQSVNVPTHTREHTLDLLITRGLGISNLSVSDISL